MCSQKMDFSYLWGCGPWRSNSHSVPKLLQEQQCQRDSWNPGAIQRHSNVAGPRNRLLQVGQLPAYKASEHTNIRASHLNTEFPLNTHSGIILSFSEGSHCEVIRYVCFWELNTFCIQYTLNLSFLDISTLCNSHFSNAGSSSRPPLLLSAAEQAVKYCYQILAGRSRGWSNGS